MYNVLYKDKNGNLTSDTALAMYAGSIDVKSESGESDKTRGIFIHLLRPLKNQIIFIDAPRQIINTAFNQNKIDLTYYGNAIYCKDTNTNYD